MSVDLTLPRTSSPIIDEYKDLPETLNPFALFVHVELEDAEEIARIERKCNEEIRDISDGQDDSVRRASPRWDFQGEPLHASVMYFLETVLPTRRWDYFYYVAVVDKDWEDKGVLLVTMDDDTDEDEARIDIVRVPAKEAGLALVNLQIANTAWEDYQDTGSEEDEDNAGSDWASDNGNDGDEEVDYHDDALELSWEASIPHEDYSDGAGNNILSGRYWFGLYTAPGVPWKPLLYELEPAWGARSLDFPDLPCRPEGRLTGTTKDELIAEAKHLHPMRCRNNPVLLRTMFLIADEQEYKDKGFLLVKVDWDFKAAENPDYSMPDLAALGVQAEIDSQRVGFHDGTTMTIVDQLVEGSRPWKPLHKSFGAYAGPAIQLPHYYLKAVDKSFLKRHAGSEKFIQWTIDYTERGMSQNASKAFRRTLLEHWKQWAPEERFRFNFCPTFFIWCNEELKAKDTDKTVWLVKTDADGDWSVRRCAAGKAYGQLCDIVDGKETWEGVHAEPE